MSTSTGRYQSHILNFFNRQTQRLKDRTATAARQLQLGLLWGTQLALYPIYAAFQATRLVGRQLTQAARSARVALQARESSDSSVTEGAVSRTPNLANLAPDRAIQQVLTDLWGLDLATGLAESHPGPMASTAQRPIQGIACSIATRQIVLTTATNEILDILTLAQQHQLRTQIIIAMNRYERQQLVRQPVHSSLLVPRPRPQQLPVVRRFLRLMAWVQGGTIAHSINLFQETKFLPEATDAWPGWPSLSGFPELPRLRPGEPVLAPWTAAAPLARDGSNLVVDGPPVTAQIDSLIRSAIQFFFGNSPGRRAQLPSAPPAPGQSVGALGDWQTDPWALDGHPAAPDRILRPSRRNQVLPPALKPRLTNIPLGFTGPLAPPLAHPRPAPPPQAPLTPRHSGDMAADPDWIEVEGSPIGYDKHPLEQILGWLDIALSGMEQQIGQIWYRIRRWLSDKTG